MKNESTVRAVFNAKIPMFVIVSFCAAAISACNLFLPTGTIRDPNASDETLAVFQDPDSEFSTTDVNDVDGEIVQFDTASNRIIWVEDNIEFDDWEVDGNFLGSDRFFQVRFGTEDGERKAYFTETEPATICDIEVINNTLSITATAETVPQE